MKSFFQFLTETTASQQAARLGLQGDGHGGWYKDGEFVAKTEKGRLRFFNKRQSIGGKDPKQTDLEKNVSDPNFVDPALQQQQQQQQTAQPAEQPVEQPPAEQPVEQPPAPQPLPVQSPDLAAGPPPVPKTRGTLTIGFGRFNPPHAGHLKLMDLAASSSESDGGDYIIVPSRSYDPKKNPLDPDTKVSMMRQLFPQHSSRIQNDQNTRTIFDILKKAHNDGYANVRIVGGEDRVKEFTKLSNNYNGQLYNFDNIEVLSSGERDEQKGGVAGLSASRMRLAVAENDFKTYYNHLQKEEPIIDPETGEQMMQTDPETGEFLTDPETGEMIPATQMVPLVDRKTAKQMFVDTRASMGIQDNVTEFWEIAPKFNYQILRENYVNKTIFKLGELVENLNTGLIGRIIRRGTNYLICVTEDNIMFKSWIKDVMEAKLTNRSGVRAKDRLVGTDNYRKYVESMVPGCVSGYDFINRNRKSK